VYKHRLNEQWARLSEKTVNEAICPGVNGYRPVLKQEMDILSRNSEFCQGRCA